MPSQPFQSQFLHALIDCFEKHIKPSLLDEVIQTVNNVMGMINEEKKKRKELKNRDIKNKISKLEEEVATLKERLDIIENGGKRPSNSNYGLVPRYNNNLTGVLK